MKYTWLDLTINRQTRTHNLVVTGLGKQKIILGYPWFKQINPDRLILYIDSLWSYIESLTRRNAHLLGEQNRMKENLYPNQQLK
jgi:hypothetical protein